MGTSVFPDRYFDELFDPMKDHMTSLDTVFIPFSGGQKVPREVLTFRQIPF